MKSYLLIARPLALLVLAGLSVSNLHAAPTKVGNGDEGSDLEGFTPVTSGPIVESRDDAVKLLESLNIAGVPSLGMTLPELKTSKLYRTKKDSSQLESTDSGAFHADMKGRVYARTFAEPHAATRFFPVAEKLDRDQLVALHIHEALHRSLPESVRENESVVSGLTLAITTPGASFDSVNRAVIKWVPETERGTRVAGGSAAARPAIPQSARVRNPSELSYSYRHFRRGSDQMQFPVENMHVLRSDLYPFGSDESPIGIGIEASLIGRPQGSLMGPLSLSGRARLWSSRGFDIGAWAVASLNTLSAEELKNSQFGRDAYTAGLSMRKDVGRFSIENFLGYTLESKSNQKIGNIDYSYSYGDVIAVSTHPAFLAGAFRIGGFMEFTLGDHYRVTGGAFNYDPGRYRLVSGGPELQYRVDSYAVGLSGRFLIDATADASFDSLGDLMGAGVAQGNLTATLSIFF